VLYDYVVDPATSQPSKETSGAFPLMKKKTFPSAFLELMTVEKQADTIGEQQLKWTQLVSSS